MVWLLMGVLLGLTIAAVLYLQGADRLRQDQSWLSEPGTGVPEPQAPPTGTSAPPPRETVTPRFEFYDLLPRDEIAVPAPPPRPAPPTPAPAPPPAPAPAATPSPAPAPTATPSPATVPAPAAATRQILQTGAFRQFEQADAQKAMLAFLGFHAHIEPVRISGQQFHRVILGPFATEDQLRNAEDRLRNANIEAYRRPAS